MSGTRIAYAAICLRPYYAMSGTDLAHAATQATYARSLLSLPGTPRYPPTARSAMSGTNIAYAVVCLRACYAMSGTEIAYGAVGRRSGG
eukprot:1430361-Rhodomonas_salina.5